MKKLITFYHLIHVRLNIFLLEHIYEVALVKNTIHYFFNGYIFTCYLRGKNAAQFAYFVIEEQFKLGPTAAAQLRDLCRKDYVPPTSGI